MRSLGLVAVMGVLLLPTAANVPATELLPSTTGAQHFFGSSCAIDDDTLVVGSPGISAAFAFVRSGGTWVEQQKLVGDAARGDDRFRR